MTKFQRMGYTEKNIKVRHMTIAELKVLLYQDLRTQQLHFAKLRLVDTYAGETTNFNNVHEFMMNEWCGNCKIDVFHIKVMDIYNDESKVYDKTIVIIFADTDSE